MENLNRTHPNLTITWHKGSKSFVEIYSNPLHTGRQRIDRYFEAPIGEQISEQLCLMLFHEALALSVKFPERHIGYVRYDKDDAAENENNRPFRDGGMEKNITYDGCIYKAKL